MNVFASNIINVKGLVHEVIHGFVWGLDGKIFERKLTMHVNCFDEIQKT